MVIYKNAEFHNVSELITNEDGSVSWRRVPTSVMEQMEMPNGVNMVHNCVGVELRFVLKGDSATVRISAADDNPETINSFHIYRGGLQCGWWDEVHSRVTGIPKDFVIEKPKNPEGVKKMAEMLGHQWDSDVIRIIFDRGVFKIHDIIGDVEPPRADQKPKKTLLTYGSSITSGSNAWDMSHAWFAVLGYNLDMDVRNIGMSGSCSLEPAFAEFIASEGEKGNWDIATLEMGINVLEWEDEKIYDRVENMLVQVAGRNPDKPIFVISPFYHCGEAFYENDNTANWRSIIEELVNKFNYKNVTYINGLDVLDNMSYICADEVHPNIYGVQRIADVLTEKIKSTLGI